MAELAVNHVGHCFEATVGMPGCSLGFTWRVLNFTHLIEMNEWVEEREVNAGEGAANRESFSFEALRTGRYRSNRTLDQLFRRGGRHSRKTREVFYGYGWHEYPC